MKIGNKFKVLLLVSLLFLSSCGVFNKVFKSSNKNKENTEIKVNKETNTSITDKSETVIKERLDTTVYTKPSNFNSNTSVTSLKDFNDLVVLHNDLIEIRQTYDTLKKIVNTKVLLNPQGIRAVLERTTTVKTNIETLKLEKTDSVYKKLEKSKETVKTKEPINMFWYFGLGLGALATVYFVTKNYLLKKA